jgi:hypothetical protein
MDIERSRAPLLELVSGRLKQTRVERISLGRSWTHFMRRGHISNPATKNKSVWLSEEGAKLSEELVEKLFAVK